MPLGEVPSPTLPPQNGREKQPPNAQMLQAEKKLLNESLFNPRQQARKASKTLNCSFNSNQSNHLSNEKHPGCLGCIGSYTNLCYRVYHIQLLGIPIEQPPELVKVDYSGLNYKDGMAICGIYGVVETLPLITGIDFVGVVDASRHGKEPKSHGYNSYHLWFMRSLFRIQISIDIPNWMMMMMMMMMFSYKLS